MPSSTANEGATSKKIATVWLGADFGNGLHGAVENDIAAGNVGSHIRKPDALADGRQHRHRQFPRASDVYGAE